MRSDVKSEEVTFSTICGLAKSKGIDVDALVEPFSLAVSNHARASQGLNSPGLSKSKFEILHFASEDVISQTYADGLGRYELQTSIQRGIPVLQYVAPKGRMIERMLVIGHNEGDCIVMISLDMPPLKGSVMYLRNDQKRISRYIHNGETMSPSDFEKNLAVRHLIDASGIGNATSEDIWSSAAIIIKGGL